jgi:Cof subfamily protein (haloacid dehalogenase superfamily)
MSFHSTSGQRPPHRQIRALVSDIDGTLVTSEKRLSRRTLEAVAALHERGILFSVVSSRPPRGLKRVADALAVTAPMAAFNGGVLLTPDLSPIEEHVLPAIIARYAVDELMARGVDVWVFNGDDWYVANGASPYVARETRALGFDPIMVSDFEPMVAGATKVVGLSVDLGLIERCEKEIGRRLAGGAAVVRSQNYALDITHPLANKGAALAKIAARMATPLSEIAVIGDGGNDLAMFAQSGLSVAMGNASPAVQSAADFITGSNDHDGFAEAVEHLFLSTATPANWASNLAGSP